jgi:mycobactin peptide synthetase MbtE
LELLPPAALEKLFAAPTPREDSGSQPITRGSVETEQALIAMLEELLDITGVDLDDNFFAIGGDSIISVQLAARATAQGLTLTPAMVFEYMTIAELAGAVDAATDQHAVEADSALEQKAAPMSASGLDADAVARLTASWQKHS